jgi:hypothetical protein
MRRPTTTRSLLLAGAAAFCTLIGLPQARAADHMECERYAHIALEQRERAREMRCFRSIDLHSFRWSPEFQDHYRWCRHEPFHALERERRIRREELERCRG